MESKAMRKGKTELGSKDQVDESENENIVCVQGGVKVCLCVGWGDRTTSSLIMLWLLTGWGSLPPSALLSLSPSRSRLGRGLHSPRPSRGSLLLSLRLSSAPAAPCRELPPLPAKGGGTGRRAAQAEVTWPPEP